jgi:hypothetical protein
MSANAVYSPRRAYRDGPDHVPAGTPLRQGRRNWDLGCYVLTCAGSAQNTASAFHIDTILDGPSIRETAKKLGISKSKVERKKKKAIQRGLLDA